MIESSQTVLVVDDNPTNLQVLYKTLQPAGYRILIASQGQDAVEIAKAEKPDLVLLDIMMPPGIDGFETLRRLQSHSETQGVSVVMLSSLDDTQSKLRCFEAGAVDYVAKPFQAEEVMARVSTQLRLSELQRRLEKEKTVLKVANEKMQKDLDTAARIQRSLLPAQLPQVDNYDFAWRCRPCATLGGDALDIFRINDRVVGFYLLDVSGHGVPSALLAVAVGRSLAPRTDHSSIVISPDLRKNSLNAVAPAEVARRLNRIFPLDSSNPHFFTMFYATLNVLTGSVDYVSAGHPGPIRIDANGYAHLVSDGCAPIGVDCDQTFKSRQFQMSPGERLFVYSDGLYEQRNEEGLRCGQQWLMETVAAAPTTASKTVESVFESLAEWSRDVPIADDLSAICLSRNSK
ncbi:MAG: SpoIIE family protein phosphatase [Xanthomonadales bacterium]|nr:SpoIIE family protein phosphatase [Xanthomonadales bacterium]